MSCFENKDTGIQAVVWLPGAQQNGWFGSVARNLQCRLIWGRGTAKENCARGFFGFPFTKPLGE